jgi:hypothetical protein
LRRGSFRAYASFVSSDALKLLGARGLAILSILLSASSCADEPDDEDPDPCAGATRCVAEGELPFETLSEYDFFVREELAALAPKDGVLLYEPVAPLWSDGARKLRHIILPTSEAADADKVDFDAGEAWAWPDGTIIAKTFSFDHDRRDPAQGYRVIETRLLIREAGAWTTHVYLWNDDQTDATRHKIGARVDINVIDESGAAQTQEYIVPNLEQCGGCHERDDVLELLGPFTHQLNRDVERDGDTVNQLEWLAGHDVFSGPIPAPATLERFAAPDAALALP